MVNYASLPRKAAFLDAQLCFISELSTICETKGSIDNETLQIMRADLEEQLKEITKINQESSTEEEKDASFLNTVLSSNTHEPLFLTGNWKLIHRGTVEQLKENTNKEYIQANIGTIKNLLAHLTPSDFLSKMSLEGQLEDFEEQLRQLESENE